MVHATTNNQGFIVTTEPTTLTYGVVGNWPTAGTYILIPSIILGTSLSAVDDTEYSFEFTQNVTIFNINMTFKAGAAYGGNVTFTLFKNDIETLLTITNNGNDNFNDNTTNTSIFLTSSDRLSGKLTYT